LISFEGSNVLFESSGSGVSISSDDRGEGLLLGLLEELNHTVSCGGFFDLSPKNGTLFSSEKRRTSLEGRRGLEGIFDGDKPKGGTDQQTD